MTRHGIEPRSPGPLANTLLVIPMARLAELNPRKSTRKLGLDLNTSQSTICRHLKMIGKVGKLGVSVSHTLSEKNKEDLISTVTSLLSKQLNDLFLKNITRYDENESFMTMINAKGSELSKTNIRSQLMKESYAVYTEVLFILSFSDTQYKFILAIAATSTGIGFGFYGCKWLGFVFFFFQSTMCFLLLVALADMERRQERETKRPVKLIRLNFISMEVRDQAIK